MDKFFDYLQQLGSYNHKLLINTQRNEILKVAQMSKNIKFIDDLIITEVVRIRVLKDKQFLNNNKINLNLKTCLKKTKVIVEKHLA